MARRYDPSELEPRWQAKWQEDNLFKALDLDLDRPKYYILDMFPFPSGAGLHVGHPEGYTATDILSRFKRMNGFNVLHPMGWDAFGLPAEQHAIKTQTHPRVTTDKNIGNFRRQIQRLGFSYDWDREVDTTDPNYYRWTQWIFLKLMEMGLAYQDEIAVNWCPELGTVLANEEVTADGKSERGGFDVVRRPMKQWVLKITAYADRLLDGLDDLDWPEGIKEMQRQWIGRSEGATVRFNVKDSEDHFEIYTTRPDTLFGCTYCVLAPEHPLVSAITTADQKDAVDAYVDAASRKSELSRTSQDDKSKTGVFTGAYAINPATGEPVPVWVADYVLISYGTGAIMAVPGQDQRDWDFATTFDIPIIRTVQTPEGWEGEAFTGNGVAINSGFLNGMEVAEAKSAMTAWLVEKGLGEGKVNYRLRDWVFSRQRYWGEPFPVIHVDGEARGLPLSELPVTLPEVEKYQPTGTGESPLASQMDWVNTTDPRTGEAALRETDTMPNWAGSCWYYLRYIDPKNPDQLIDPAKENYWMPVDLYVGGAEHAVLHLLYARFWHKVLFDIGVVSTEEPFQRLLNQGMILGSNGEKMSKSLGNVVNPDDIVDEFGADSLRLYEMFMGPLEAVKPWNTQGVHGILRFLKRVYRLVDDLESGERTWSDKDVNQTLRHQTIKKVTEDTEALRFNTAIAQMMTFTNALYKEGANKDDVRALILLLSPYAPHLADECWTILGGVFGGKAYTMQEAWPEFDEALTKEASVTIGLSINGKKRGSLEIPLDADKGAVLEMAKAHPNIERYLTGKTLVKEIVVPGRMVNFVVKG